MYLGNNLGSSASYGSEIDEDARKFFNQFPDFKQNKTKFKQMTKQERFLARRKLIVSQSKSKKKTKLKKKIKSKYCDASRTNKPSTFIDMNSNAINNNHLSIPIKEGVTLSRKSKFKSFASVLDKHS